MGRNRLAQVSQFQHASRFSTGTMLAAFLLFLATFAAAQTPQKPSHPQDSEEQNNPLAQLKWRFIGPNGNRAAAIAGVAGNPLVDYVGAASGGIWKTENGGVTWKPVFDHEDVSAIGALAVSQ